MATAKYKNESQIFKAFANAKRLEIVSRLKTKELCVHDLVRSMKFRQSNISQHLKVLKQAGIITQRRDGKNVYYRLSTRTFGEIPDNIMKEQQKS